MRLNFDFVFQSLDKKDVHEYDERGIKGDKSSAYKWLASRLANWPKAKDRLTAYRYVDMARRLYDNGWIEVERSDRKLIEQLIEEDPMATALMQEQLLTVIDKAVEKEAKAQEKTKKTNKVHIEGTVDV